MTSTAGLFHMFTRVNKSLGGHSPIKLQVALLFLSFISFFSRTNKIYIYIYIYMYTHVCEQPKLLTHSRCYFILSD